MGSTTTASRSGQLGALATVALWCSSFALIKHLVDAGLGAQDVAIGRFVVAWPGFVYLLWRAGGLPGLTPRRGAAHPRRLGRRRDGLPPRAQRGRAHDRLRRRRADRRAGARRDARARARRRPRALRARAASAGIALAFAGVVVVVVLGLGRDFSLHGLRGPLLVLVAPLTFAVYNVLYKPLLGRYDLPALTAAGGLVGSLLFLPFENTGAIDRFGALDAGSWIALAALGLGATLGGYVTWSIALRGLEPSRAMSYLYCVPPLAVAIGALRSDEPVTLWLLLGGALVIGGVARRTAAARTKGGNPADCLHRGAPTGNDVALEEAIFARSRGCDPRCCSLSRRSPAPTPEPARSSCSAAVGWSSMHADRLDGTLEPALDARERRAPAARAHAGRRLGRSRRARAARGHDAERDARAGRLAERRRAAGPGARGPGAPTRRRRRRRCTSTAIILFGFSGRPAVHRAAAGCSTTLCGAGAGHSDRRRAHSTRTTSSRPTASSGSRGESSARSTIVDT